MTDRPTETPIERIFKLCGKQATCGYCGRQIWWMYSKNKKPMPFDDDGTSHFATCPNYERPPRARAS